LYDTVFALITVYLTFNLSLSIWILMGYFEGVPIELERAAMIDGASRLQTLTKIILPISKPAIITVSIIVFLFSWNEFLFAFLLTPTAARTVPAFVADFMGIVVIDCPAMTAISTLFILPTLIRRTFPQMCGVRCV